MSHITDDSSVANRQSGDECDSACDEDEPLLTLCEEMVTSLEALKSEDGPINRAESDALPPEKMEQVWMLQC